MTQPPVQEYLTAFVDLLGFSAELERLQDPAQAALAASELAAAIATFRNVFQSFYSIQSSRFRDAPPIQLAGRDLAVWQARVPVDAIIQAFTDTVIVSIPVEATRPLALAVSFHLLVGGCATASLVLLSQRGVALRGGISHGPGTVLEANEVVGTGLVKAHTLEQNEAIYPRIVVDPELPLYIAGAVSTTADALPDEAGLALRFGKVTERYLFSDADGYDVVDFLGAATVDKTAEYEAKFKTNVRDLVDNKILLGINAVHGSSSGSRKARAKWAWLRTYANAARNRITP